MAEPNKEDLRVAREAIEAELGKRGTTGLEALMGRSLDKLEIRFASAIAAERERVLSPDRDEAIKYLESIAAPVTEGRILLAQFLATNPTVKQIHLATSLVIEERDRTAAAEREKAAKIAQTLPIGESEYQSREIAAAIRRG